MDNYQKLLNKSYRFLSIRPRSEKEIKDYLSKNKSDLPTSKKIIDKLKEHRFLDDKQFAKFWIEQRTKVKPRAFRVIKFELKQKGIGSDLIEEILEDKELEIESELEMALKLAQRKLPRYKQDNPQKKYEKMSRFLASKGFNYDIIKDVIDQTLRKDYNR